MTNSVFYQAPNPFAAQLSELRVTLIALGILACFVGGLSYVSWRISIWRNPCTEVVINNEVVYRGNAKFYQTKSRGTATIYQEHQQRWLLPRMTKEIITNDIKVNPISCEI